MGFQGSTWLFNVAPSFFFVYFFQITLAEPRRVHDIFDLLLLMNSPRETDTPGNHRFLTAQIFILGADCEKMDNQ